MKKKKQWILYYSPILLSIASSALALIFYFANFHEGISNDADTWGTFGSYTGGVIGPIVSITGFYYVILSLTTARRDRYADNIKVFSEKIEHEIDSILQKHVYVLYNSHQSFAKFSVNELFRFNSAVNVNAVHLDEAKTTTTNLNKEIQDIVEYLRLLSTKLILLHNIQAEEVADVVDYYKTKFGSTVEYLSNRESYYVAVFLMNWSSQGGKYKRTIESLTEIKSFYMEIQT